jgi:hypothetical protein
MTANKRLWVICAVGLLAIVASAVMLIASARHYRDEIREGYTDIGQVFDMVVDNVRERL